MSSVEKLIREYEWLRQLAETLDVQTNLVDSRLVEIEPRLPDDYTFPGDPLMEDG
jgi:hypothetical protein